MSTIFKGISTSEFHPIMGGALIHGKYLKEKNKKHQPPPPSPGFMVMKTLKVGFITSNVAWLRVCVTVVTLAAFIKLEILSRPIFTFRVAIKFALMLINT